MAALNFFWSIFFPTRAFTPPPIIPEAAVTAAPNTGFTLPIAPPKVEPIPLIALPAPELKPLLRSLFPTVPTIPPIAGATALKVALDIIEFLGVLFILPISLLPLSVACLRPP